MKHFYENIHGWFDFDDIYKNMVEKAKDNWHFVEVGTWYGRSATYMAVEIENSGKLIKFDCVDTWKGSEEHQNTDKNIIEDGTIYPQFLQNIEPVKHIINPIKTTSIEAAKLYEDESLDFIFIDASHDYDNVKADIEAWFPKLKKHRIFAGHDYYWAGVKKAVDELFQDKKILISKSSWMVVKE